MGEKRVALLFPGQGAQYVGMGRAFCETFTTAKELFQWGDELLNRSLSRLIFSGPEEELTKTRNSQPAIFITSMALWHVLQEQFPGLRPALCAGFSLGEYSAVAAGKWLPLSEALPLVGLRAELMNGACEDTDGAMAAVVGLAHEEVERLVAELSFPGELWVANYNCPGQTVLSGTRRALIAAEEALKRRGARRYLPLAVHGAFHSGLMDRARRPLGEALAAAPFAKEGTPIATNATGTLVKERGELIAAMERQIVSPVYWESAIRSIDQQGIELYLEIGCGKTLAAFNKRIGTLAPTLSVENPADLELVARVLSE